MMANLIELMASILNPITSTVLIAAILGGLVFGRFYNKRLKLPSNLIYHKFIAGAVFLISIAIVKFAATGSLAMTGYIGVGILWGIYVFFIWLGTKL